jgi:hypothetical protein
MKEVKAMSPWVVHVHDLNKNKKAKANNGIDEKHANAATNAMQLMQCN